MGLKKFIFSLILAATATFAQAQVANETNILGPGACENVANVMGAEAVLARQGRSVDQALAELATVAEMLPKPFVELIEGMIRYIHVTKPEPAAFAERFFQDCLLKKGNLIELKRIYAQRT